MEQLITSTAVDTIRDLAIAASDKLNANAGVAAVIAPNEFHAIDTEKYQPHRRRFRGQLQTNSLADFILYVKLRASGSNQKNQPATSGTVVPGFIDADRLNAIAIFNLGTVEQPGHADDTATLQLKASAAYAALLAAHGGTLQHLDALNWLQDWADNITYADEDGTDLPSTTSYNALRKVTISALNESSSEERTHGTSRSALASVDARGAGQLPALIRFGCTPYAGLPERHFWLRLNIRDQNGKPVFQLRVRNLDAEKEAVAQDFKKALLDELQVHATLTLGTFTP